MGGVDGEYGEREDDYRSDAVRAAGSECGRVLQSGVRRYRSLAIDGEGGAVVARLSVDGAEFWVADESPEHKNFSPETLGGGTVRMVLTVSDPDAAFDRAVSAGAAAVHPVTNEYGWRLGRIADPFGHHWEIGKPLSEAL